MTGKQNTPALKQRSGRASQKRGFSLIESAIVLGVVGLVIGGIWVAAATLYENYKVNKTVSDIALIVKNAQGLISGRDGDEIGNSINITVALMNAGVFPKDWVINGNTVKSPFGQARIDNFTGPPRFDLRLYGISTSVCIKLIVKLSNGSARSSGGIGYQMNNGLGYIQINYDDWSTSVLPVSTDTATTACSERIINYIVFTFGYTRINN